ncbi:hypothetical protein MTR67_017892 [Solanum verrucosum]|uniref:Uncharacterized protein n=1 Tax=Solanum verrucosum TaxID=315347 RepID=A0AAF0QIR7_SOLVR|nr:hypothetical protein MTR67_017892 [Solanum verrucosum]
MPPTTKIPVFATIVVFYESRRLRKNKEVWIRKSFFFQGYKRLKGGGEGSGTSNRPGQIKNSWCPERFEIP